MHKIKKSIYTVLAISMLVFPLAGCGNDDEDEDKGKEENGVHVPDDEVQSTDEKEDQATQADQ